MMYLLNRAVFIALFVLLGSNRVGDVMAQTAVADSLRGALAKTEGEERTKTYKRLMLEMMQAGDAEAVLQVIDQWRSYEASRHHVANEADARWDKVIILYNAQLYDTLVADGPEQLEWFKQHERWEDYYSTWRFVVFSYHYTSKTQTALRQAQAMLNDAQQRDNNYGRAWAYQLMGNIYSDIGQHDLAADALRKSVDLLNDEKDDTEYIDQAYNLLCQVQNEQKDFKSLEQSCVAWRRSLDERAKRDGKEKWNRSFLSFHQNYFNILLSKGLLDDALQEIQRAEELNKQVDSDNELATLLRHHAQLALKRGDVRRALIYSDSLNHLEQGQGKGELLRADILLQAGRGAEAAVIYKAILEQQDSVYTRESRMQLDELNTLFRLDELQMKGQLERSRFLTGIIAIVLVGLLIFLLFRYRAGKRLAVAHTALQHAYSQLEETTTAKERIESELRIARDIQMSMVPHVFPNRKGLDLYASMTPAREVGGDLYNYVLAGDKLYFCVGDVSGKGVPASLFMAQATRLFRTLAGQQMMPAEIVTRMNAELSADNEQGMFVTMFIGLVDLQTGHLDYCNAGHNPPVIGGSSAHGEFLEMLPNAPIGLWPDLVYEGEEIESIKGRPLFIYTDGLNEAENIQQQQFGDERLLQVLRSTRFERASQVVSVLNESVLRHRQGAEPNDDLTMMCLRIE